MKKSTEENTGGKTDKELPDKQKKRRKKSTSLSKTEFPKEQNKKGNTGFKSLSDVREFIKDKGAFEKDSKEWSSKQIETLQTLVEKFKLPRTQVHSFQMLKGMPQISNEKIEFKKFTGKI